MLLLPGFEQADGSGSIIASSQVKAGIHPRGQGIVRVKVNFF
jgi:hypothetical protein